MSHDPDLDYGCRMGLSWHEGPEPPQQNTVSLTVLELAMRLEEIARELHVAYRNRTTRLDNIVVALQLLDLLQAEID